MPEPTSAAPQRTYKDNEFYMSFLTFKVGNALFKIPAEPFETRSEVFRDMFSLSTGEGEGKSDDAPIVLVGVDVEDFKAFLRFLFPRRRTNGSESLEFSNKEWVGIHALAHMWAFEDARNASKAALVRTDDFILKLELATRYKYSELLHTVYSGLAYRPSSLTVDECRQIGIDMTSRVAHLRELRLATMSKHRVHNPNAQQTYSNTTGCNCSTCRPRRPAFPCPHCQAFTSPYNSGENLECIPCGVVFHENKAAVDTIVSNIIEQEIRKVIST